LPLFGVDSILVSRNVSKFQKGFKVSRVADVETLRPWNIGTLKHWNLETLNPRLYSARNKQIV